jgi:hypothetical protein
MDFIKRLQKKVIGFGNVLNHDEPLPNPSLEQAERNARQRALEQRENVIDIIEHKTMLEVPMQSQKFSKFFGQTDAPAAVVPSVLTTRTFRTTKDSYSDAQTVATGAIVVDPPGSVGLNTIQTTTLTDPATGIVSAGTTYNPNNNQEFVLGQLSVGVGTDFYFDKPSMSRGDLYSTRITGFFRFTNEIGAAPANTGFMNNGVIRLKVIDPMKQTVKVLLEVSTEKFNQAAQNNPNSGVGSPVNPHDLNNMLYPNNAVSAVVPSGSIIQITLAGLFENQFAESDAGVVTDLAAFAGCFIDGSRSQFNIATHRIQYFESGRVPLS